MLESPCQAHGSLTVALRVEYGGLAHEGGAVSEQSASHGGQEVFHGDLLTVRVETVPSPTGAPKRYEIVEHPDAVAIVALRAAPADPAGGQPGQPEVALVRQSRPALGRETWELPAGLVGADERAKRAATRELHEETGYVARTWRQLAHEYSSPGFSTEAITIFLATDLERDETISRDADILAVEWLPFDQALERVRSGQIEDGKTLLGLTLAASAIGGAMPVDPTNMPFPRRDAGGASAAGPLDGQLRLETMLMEEFNYAGVSAYQAYEDRARMFNLYLLLIGVLASGLGALYQLGGGFQAFTPYLTFALLFIAGSLGIIFFVKLIRLRQAHRDSLITMNLIKAHYINMFAPQYENLQNVFNWRLETIPSDERVGSITFLINFTIAFLDSLCLAAAVFFAYVIFMVPAGLDKIDSQSLIIGLLASAIALVLVAMLQILIYRRILSRRRNQERLTRAEQRIAQVRLTGES
jgi:ADP-ribose pyrophosphatase